MVCSLIRVAVRDKAGESGAADEAQRRNRALCWSARGIRQEQAAKLRRRRYGVVEFDEIVIGRELRVSQPFVDLQQMIIAERRVDIGRAQGWSAQRPFA